MRLKYILQDFEFKVQFPKHYFQFNLNFRLFQYHLKQKLDVLYEL